MLDTIFAVILTLMNTFGGPFDNEDVNTILRAGIHIAQEYNTEEDTTTSEQQEDDHSFPKVLERYDEEEVAKADNHKPSILDYDGNTLYNFYQNKNLERVNEFHENIKNGGI